MKQKIIVSALLVILNGVIIPAYYDEDKLSFDDGRRICVPEGSANMSNESLNLNYIDPLTKEMFKNLLNNASSDGKPSFVARCTSAISNNGSIFRSYYYCSEEFLDAHLNQDDGTLKNIEKLAHGRCPEYTEFYIFGTRKSNTSFHSNPRFVYLFNHQDLAKTATLLALLNSLKTYCIEGITTSLFEWSNNLAMTDLRKEVAMVAINEFSENEKLKHRAKYELGKYYFAQDPQDVKAKRWFAGAYKNHLCTNSIKEALIDVGKCYEAQEKYEDAQKAYERARTYNVDGAQEALDRLKDK